MALIRIVESTELRPELSLRASDYFKEETMNALAQQRLETGKPALTHGDVAQLTKEPLAIPALAIGQLWEASNKWQHNTNGLLKRRVKVISIDATHATVKNVDTGNITKVRVSAFRGRTQKDYHPVANGS